jgi:hypothetical protein
MREAPSQQGLCGHLDTRTCKHACHAWKITASEEVSTLGGGLRIGQYGRIEEVPRPGQEIENREEAMQLLLTLMQNHNRHEDVFLDGVESSAGPKSARCEMRAPYGIHACFSWSPLQNAT